MSYDIPGITVVDGVVYSYGKRVIGWTGPKRMTPITEQELLDVDKGKELWHKDERNPNNYSK